MSWGKIYCDTNWGENKYRTAGSIINEATPDCFQFPEFVTFKDHVRTEGATYEKMQCGIDILLFLGRSISITPKSPDNPTFSGILDTYTGATAGYSTRRLTNTYTGGLIRVRRSSDDAEQDIGYDANGEDMDIFGLLAFVNADVNQYTSDYSTDTDGMAFFNATLSANESVGGLDDALKVTSHVGSGQINTRKGQAFADLNGNTYRLQAKVYIPSTNAQVDGVKVWTGYSSGVFADVSTTDSWVSVDQTLSLTQGNNLFFSAKDGGSINVTTTEANVFYVKDVVVTQTTADGHITTFYDQTGNGNHATNSTASEQPLIVDGGSIIYEGATISRPATDFDGTDDHFDVSGLTSILSTTASHSTYIVHKGGGVGGDMLLQSTQSGGDRFGVGYQSNEFRASLFDGSFTSKSSASNQAGNHLLSTTIWDTSNLDVYLNADDSDMTGSGNAGTSNVVNTCIGARSNGTLDPFDGTIQEVIIYPNANDSTTQQGIETAINNYFSIYTP